MRFVQNVHTVEDIKKEIENHVNGRKFTGKMFEDIQISRLPCFIFSMLRNEYEIIDENISIQASEYHYSVPRANAPEYTSVEIGFPPFKFREAFIKQYADDPENPLDTIYAFVPIQELAEELHCYLNRPEPATEKGTV